MNTPINIEYCINVELMTCLGEIQSACVTDSDALKALNEILWIEIPEIDTEITYQLY